MRAGFDSATVSYPKPRRERLPGRKFSMRTSASRIRVVRAAAPSGLFRSSATLFLLRLRPRKNVLHPSHNGAHARVSSPRVGSSILSTSAPMSPRSMAQNGPARTRVKSTTLSPSRGGMVRRIICPGCAGHAPEVSCPDSTKGGGQENNYAICPSRGGVGVRRWCRGMWRFTTARGRGDRRCWSGCGRLRLSGELRPDRPSHRPVGGDTGSGGGHRGIAGSRASSRPRSTSNCFFPTNGTGAS